MPGSISRLDGPHNDLLTEIEVAQQLKISISTLRRLIKAKRFPPPLPNVSGRLWYRADAIWFCLNPGIRVRMDAIQSGSNPSQSASSDQPEENDA